MVMNRIDAKFKELRKSNKKAFITFITAGDPSLKVTEELVLAFENSGVDMVELGVPFSDPMADGPTIQASSERALNKNVTLQKIFETVAWIRKHSEIPILLMMYYNSVLAMGEEQFVRQSASAGVDGVIIPDLPPEEAGTLIKAARKLSLATVFFLSPTTAPDRVKKIIRSATGFIYYVSITGVTGAKRNLPSDVLAAVRLAQRKTRTPVCVGFGVSTALQVKSMSAVADGVIVGSAIVHEIYKNNGKKELVKNVARFVADLAKGLK